MLSISKSRILCPLLSPSLHTVKADADPPDRNAANVSKDDVWLGYMREDAHGLYVGLVPH